MKTHVITELKKETPILSLIFATVALGMGLDVRCITRKIHCRPPTTIEKYLQEIRRAGRTGDKCIAVLYFNNKDIAKNRKGLNEEIIQYCKNSEKPICLNSFNTLLMFIF